MELRVEEKDGTVERVIINDKYELYYNVDTGEMELTKNDIYDNPESELGIHREGTHKAIFW